MVENPIGDRETAAYRRVEQLIMQTALDLKIPPEVTQKYVQESIGPMAPNSSTQTPEVKDPT